MSEEKMETTSNVALSALVAFRSNLDIVANNVANMNTDGYYSENPVFKQYLDGDQSTSYVQDYATWRDTSEGSKRFTNGTFDVAINGSGYFAVNTANGLRYTRNGQFTLNAEGQLVNSKGNPVQGDGGEIQIGAEETNITIAKDGTISSDNGVLGKIPVYNFANEQALKRETGTMYDPNGQAATLNENAMVLQKHLEGSNVNAVQEMTKLIELSRKYTSTTKMVEKEYERIEKLINELTPRI